MCLRDNRGKTKNTFLIVNKITENLPQVSHISTLTIPSNVKCADPCFNETKPINNVIFQLNTEICNGYYSGCILVKTKFQRVYKVDVSTYENSTLTLRNRE